MTWMKRGIPDIAHAQQISARKAPGPRSVAQSNCSSSAVTGLRFVFRRVLPEHAFVARQSPFAIRALGEPVGNADLRVDRAGAHGDSGLVAGGDDLFETKLAVAENGDESDEHGDLR